MTQPTRIGRDAVLGLLRERADGMQRASEYKPIGRWARFKYAQQAAALFDAADLITAVLTHTGVDDATG